VDIMPTKFDSFKDARIWYELVLRRSAHWKSALAQDPRSNNNEHSLHEQKNILSEFSKWNAAMASLYALAASPEGKSNLRIASGLRLHYLAGYLSTIIISGQRNGYYDNECREIIALSRYILSSPPCHSWDTQAITHLAVVARLFRNRELRAEVVALLAATSRRREGVWDLRVLARALEWLFWLEEKGLGDDVLYVPETRLVRDVSIVNIAERRESRVSCQQPMRYSAEEMIRRKFVMKWESEGRVSV
jgi:hypothetical protein